MDSLVSVRGEASVVQRPTMRLTTKAAIYKRRNRQKGIVGPMAFYLRQESINDDNATVCKVAIDMIGYFADTQVVVPSQKHGSRFRPRQRLSGSRKMSGCAKRGSTFDSNKRGNTYSPIICRSEFFKIRTARHQKITHHARFANSPDVAPCRNNVPYWGTPRMPNA